MKGILVVNHFLKGEKFDTLHAHLTRAAAAMGIELETKTNLDLACSDEVSADFILFWDKDVNLAARLEAMGLRVFNSARAIELCDDKAKTYLALLGKVKQPKTFIAPLRFNGETPDDFIETAAEKLGLPLVFKECFGSFGEQVHLCESACEIKSQVTDNPFLLQEFIAESSGADKRLEVVGGEVVACVRRENKNDFRSNVTNGGTMTACTPTYEEKALALTACNALGLDFGGVDILDGGYVCEVNSNAHIINIMNAAGVDIAPKILEYIAGKIK